MPHWTPIDIAVDSSSIELGSRDLRLRQDPKKVHFTTQVERLLRNQLQQHLLRAAQGDAPAEMPPAEESGWFVRDKHGTYGSSNTFWAL